MTDESVEEIEGPVPGEPLEYNWVDDGELEVIINAGAGQRVKETFKFESAEMVRD